MLSALRLGRGERKWTLGMDIDRDVILTQAAWSGKQVSDVQLRVMAVVPSFVAKINDETDVRTEEEHQKQLLEIFRNIVNANGWRGYNLAMSLPSENLILRHLTLPAMPKKALQQAVKVELELNVHLPFDNPLYDFVVQEPKPGAIEKDLDIIVLAAPRHEIEPWVTFARKAGLDPILVQPSVLAARRVVMLQHKAVGHYAVVTLGYSGMEFGVFRLENLIFFRHVSVKPTDYVDMGDNSSYAADVVSEMQRSLNFVQYNLLREEHQLHGLYIVSRIPGMEVALNAMVTEFDQKVELIGNPFTVSGQVTDYLETLSDVYDGSVSLGAISMGLALLGGEQ